MFSLPMPDDLLFWFASCGGFMIGGLFSDVASIFSATQEARAAKEAQRILNEARQQAATESAKLSQQFDPFVSSAKTNLNETAGLLQKYLRETEGVQVDTGLTAADKIAYQDAAKLFNEQMVSTGNLRSGAAAFGQAELLRRVVADAESRTFNQQMAKLGLLFGGAGSLGSVGTAQGSIGLEGKRLSANMLSNAFNLAGAVAGAEIHKGAALANQIGAVGRLGDTTVNTAIGALAGGFGGLPGMTSGGWGAAGTGALLGSGAGGQIGQMLSLQQLFGGGGSKTPPMPTGAANPMNWMRY